MDLKIVPSSDVFLSYDTHFVEATNLIRSLDSILKAHGYSLVTFRHELSLDNNYFSKIRKQIENSAFFIADVGCRETVGAGCVTTADVAHEVGIAQALNKDVIAIMRKGNELKVASNLRAKDFIHYPDCVTVGSNELRRLERGIEEITTSLIVAEPVRIFHSSGPEYYSMLAKIDVLPGDVHYTGTTLRAFLRPEYLDERWLREIRKITDKRRIEEELERRHYRRNIWRKQLNSFKCIDVYQLDMLVRDLKTPMWRNMKLKVEEMQDFVKNAVQTLEEFENYEIHLITEKLNFKFWIKKCLVKQIVVVEGINWESFPWPIIGGIVFAVDDVAQEFEKEFERLHNYPQGLHQKEEVLQWFQSISKEIYAQ